MTIIPAYPGFSLVLSNKADAWVEGPIIAWKIDGDELVWPITEEMVVGDKTQPWAIQRPNGNIVLPADRTFDDLPAYIEYLKTSPIQ